MNKKYWMKVYWLEIKWVSLSIFSNRNNIKCKKHIIRNLKNQSSKLNNIQGIITYRVVDSLSNHYVTSITGVVTIL